MLPVEPPFTGNETTMTLRRAAVIDQGRLVFSSGAPDLDTILEGGFKTGEMVEVFGKSNTGKTLLSLQVAAVAAVRGFSAAFVDTEGQFRPERLATLCRSRGLDPSAVLRSVFVVRAESTDRQLIVLKKLREEQSLSSCKLLVVDTLTKNFSLEHAGSKSVARRQTALGAYLNRLARDAFLGDRAVILLNRVASVTSEGTEREVDIGGETVRHYVQKVVHLRRSLDYVMGSRSDIPGPEVRLTIRDEGLV